MMGSMMRRGSFGDGATLSLDFTTGTLDPLLIFTRSSSGTYLGADGLVKTASSNAPRFDYGTNGVLLGLLLEGSGTNLLAHTERLDEAQVSTEQYWITTYSATGVTAATTGPDGVSNSATQFAPIAGSGTCIASAAMGTSAERSFSFWAKRSSGSTNLEYTLDNGTNWVSVTTTSSWQRFTIAATTAAQRVGFRFAANNVYEIWGCQLETGSGSTSYIKNVSAAGGASRAFDILTSATSAANSRPSEFNLNDIASGASSYAAWTLLIQYARDTTSKRTYPAVLYARTNSNVQRADFRDFSGTTIEVKTQTRTVQGASSSSSTMKIALACDGTAHPSSAVNGTSATLTSGVIDAVSGIQWMQLANSSLVAGSWNPVRVQVLKMWPERKTAADLATLTS